MSMHVTGAAYGAEVEDRDISDLARIQRVCAELHAGELVDVLQSALLGEPHWRGNARALLHKISDGDLPEPRR
jgi:hypothetical protein